MIRKASIRKIATEYFKHYRASRSRLAARVITSQKFSGTLLAFWKSKQAFYKANQKKGKS